MLLPFALPLTFKPLYFSPRPYWRCYYSNTDAVIYVVDSSDRDRMGISKSELVAMLEVGHVDRPAFIALIRVQVSLSMRQV